MSVVDCELRRQSLARAEQLRNVRIRVVADPLELRMSVQKFCRPLH